MLNLLDGITAPRHSHQAGRGGSRRFNFVIIKPTHYDDDGYPIQWYISSIPSNTLAAINGLALDCVEKEVLGADADIHLYTYDETNSRVDPDRIMRALEKAGGRTLVALVGVQSNQFPRAMDIARKFRARDYQVAIGGFHVSGCISMLSELPDDIKEAQELGITIFAGEAEEGRLAEFFTDAWNDDLKPVYNFMKDLPTIQDQPPPFLPHEHLKFTAGSHSSFDLGRGCPFQCSFCTIINVQGRKSRFRSPEDLEKIIRDNMAQGINRFFITDDNFARNKDWESFFDKLIELREGEKMNIKFIIQVDTLCHKIPNFIEKAARSGVTRVFIGLENINPDNLMAAKKKQNKITEYRELLQKWRSYGTTTYAGYILGFPGDTKEAILRDIRIIQKELPLDLLEFFYLTPLPGSEDHLVLSKKGAWMDPDMNKYDLYHRVSHHPRMSDQEWEEAYEEAWDVYYSWEHIETVLRRALADGINGKRQTGNKLFLMLYFYLMVKLEGVHPLEGGFMRMKFRRDRRSDLPLESRFVFYPKYLWSIIYKHMMFGAYILRAWPMYRRLKRDPDRLSYMDSALEKASEDDVETLELITETRGGEEQVAFERKQKEVIETAKQKVIEAAE